MLRHLVLFIFFGLTSLTASAAIDSIGVENLNGKKTIVHKLEPKETYFSLSRKYNVSPQSIIQFNSNKSLQIGAIVKIPTDRSFTDLNASNTNSLQQTIQSSSENSIDYKVGPREYLYSIARKFNTTVEKLKALNNFSSNNLSIGQIIKVPSVNSNPEQTIVEIPRTPVANQEPVTNTPAILTDSIQNASERLKLPVARYGLREVNERGIAITLDDENLNETKMLALHQTAPIGTVIKITNPMTGKSTFAKVVGKFTQNELSKDAIIVVNKATANLIGALDKRFQVTLIYGVPNE
ncbi:LysM peptidoglycan-binding domain-containing protein [Daejeonella sp.]|uniref:LysM peptidoglycan-binding domain-containing protein n=1 Tax=Daejeonella sp. TaxID=2805397 RepID=UPI0025BD8213|nr:LysM peptidoglycan-binding domain-containing protein [Daejeonella sp.]